jgi:hypothetical protein
MIVCAVGGVLFRLMGRTGLVPGNTLGAVRGSLLVVSDYSKFKF